MNNSREPIGLGFVRKRNEALSPNRVGLRIENWTTLLRNQKFRNHVKQSAGANILIIPGILMNNKKTTNQIINNIINSFTPWGMWKKGGGGPGKAHKIRGLFLGTSEFKKPIKNFENVLGIKFIPKNVNKNKTLANILNKDLNKGPSKYPNIEKNIGYHLKIHEYITKFGIPTYQVTPNSGTKR